MYVGLSDFFGVEIIDKSIHTRIKLARWKSKFVASEEGAQVDIGTSDEALPPVSTTISTDSGLTSDQSAHQKAYESTSFRFLPFQNSDHDPGIIRKSDIAIYPEGCACVLYDFFSESECKEIIEQGQIVKEAFYIPNLPSQPYQLYVICIYKFIEIYNIMYHH